MGRTFAIVVTAALVGGIAGAAIGIVVDGGRSSSSNPTAAPVVAEPTSVVHSVAALPPEAIYRADSPAVVEIEDTVTRVVPPTFFAPGGTEQVGALGSGFVVDRNGDIVTNDHVVQGATAIRVGFSDGATYPATIVGADPSTDIAVVQVNAPAARCTRSRSDSGSVEVGDPVYAIGNPFGLERTMTAGIVSATGRDIKAPNGLTIPNAIQTDAPINHGNSGGPLLSTATAASSASTRRSRAARSTPTSASASPSPARPCVGRPAAHRDGPRAAPVARRRARHHRPERRRSVVHGLPARGAVGHPRGQGSPAATAGLKPRPADRSRSSTAYGVPTGGDADRRVTTARRSLLGAS